MKLWTTVIAAGAVLGATGRADAEWNWTTIDRPGWQNTELHGIDENRMVGECYDEDSNLAHGFLYDGTTWTTLDYPNAIWTRPYAISGNWIVGYWSDSSNVEHGFLYDEANSVWIEPNNADWFGYHHALGIDGYNMVGTIANLNVWDENGYLAPGYVYDIRTDCNDPNNWSFVEYPDANFYYTEAHGISGRNIVGGYVPRNVPDGTLHVRGFLYNCDSDTYISLDYPGSSLTEVDGIDGNNIVAPFGWNDPNVWGDPNNYEPNAFIDPNNWEDPNYRMEPNNWVDPNVGRIMTDPNTGLHGSLYDGATWTRLDYPGTTSGTITYRISGNKIVGAYSDDAGVTHGFLLTMPSLTLVVINEPFGNVDVEPNLALYPDANTVVTLTATANEGREFGKWIVYFDPNHFDDPCDANWFVEDTNATITVRMNSDKYIVASFKCGSGLGMAFPLMTLALGALALLRYRNRG